MATATQPAIDYPCLQGLGIGQIKVLIAFLLKNATTTTTVNEALEGVACACISKRDMWLYLASQLASYVEGDITCDALAAASKCWPCAPSAEIDKIIILGLGALFSARNQS